MTGTILIIDDEPGIRNTVKDILEDEKYQVFTAEDGPTGLRILQAEPVDIVILDVWLPLMGGIDVLKAIKKDWADIEIIIISGHASIDLAVNAVKLGAFDFIEKPLSIDRILTAVRNARSIVELRHENQRLKQVDAPAAQLNGGSEAIRAVRVMIEQAAGSNARVLISGENGTGKELAARRIHQLSERARRPFVAVNCAAIPDTLIESELFGHERGAFTDASGRRKGKFEIAHNGTLFLDEIGDMSLQAQAKVLRVIQDMRFERLGGESSIEVDVRIIAATNKDLQAAIQAGQFREDLFFRLNVLPIRMPALRERLDDLDELALHFLRELGSRPGRRFSAPALDALRAHPWPGNVRELRNCMERLVILCDETEISAETVTKLLGRDASEQTVPCPESDKLSLLFDSKLNDAKDRFERSYLVHNLRKTGYNVSKAAETMGIYPSNLHAKIKKYSIEAGE